MKLILSTSLGPVSEKEVFVFAKQIGFDGVEYVSHLADMWNLPQDIIELSSTTVPVLSVHQPHVFAVNMPIFFFEKLFGIAKFLNSECVNIHLTCLVNPLTWQNTSVFSFVEKAKKSVVPIRFESSDNILPARFFPKATYDPKTFYEYCKAHNFLMTMDVAHIASFSCDVTAFFKMAKNSISHIHLSDFGNGKEHLPLGEGSINMEEFLQEVKRSGYKGLINFETNNLPKSKELQFQKIKESFEFVKNILL